MYKELRSYSSIGNREGILLLARKLLQKGDVDLPSFISSCSFINGIELNIKCGILAFRELNLIAVNGNIATAVGITFDISDIQTSISEICRVCISYLIDNELINCSKLIFNETKDLYQIPRSAFKLDCAVFRNMLISLDALIPCQDYFLIKSDFESQFVVAIKKKQKLTQEKLMEQIEKERIIGEEGEKFVLSFEMARCPFSKDQLKYIKQISILDVAAGYDIQSLENEESFVKRYIEVKTYIGEPHFYWSTNEIEAAKLRGPAYYLYLVDYTRINEEGYTPDIIQNPIALFDVSDWKIEPHTYLAERKGLYK